MKIFNAALLASLSASASAFAPSKKTTLPSSSSQLHSTVERGDWVGYYTEMDDSRLEGKIPKDMGFDPFEFTETAGGLFFQREAEIKHARLAMLAAAGWPIAELVDAPLAKTLGATVVVDEATGRNPNILNGGLYKISPIYWAVILGAAAFIDLYQINRANNVKDFPDYIPGDLGFDPLGLYPKDKPGQLEMQQKEIANGRLAMIAVAGFVASEFVSKTGVVEQTPFFFKPFFL